MIIYLNREAKYYYRRWQRIAHMLWPRLYGVNIVWDDSGKEPEVMPVYIPFMRVERGDGHMLIELGMWTDSAIVILLFLRWPFIYVTNGGGIELDVRNIEDNE